MTARLIGHTRSMQDIGIVTSQTPNVYRPADSDRVYLTFEGLRESRTVADKRTRIRITLAPRPPCIFGSNSRMMSRLALAVRPCHRGTGRRQSADPGRTADST